jgi:selenocysteine lyase/cysteine desulfurase
MTAMKTHSDPAPLRAPGSVDAAFFEALRAREFGRLARSGHVYMDYTGSGLYGQSQLEWHRDWLCERTLGNPHSENPASLAATHEVERVRERLFDFFRADPAEYELVFTSNASGAIKLVAESFPFAPGSRFVLATDNHNSIGGMRDYARRAGADIHFLPLTDDLRLDDPLSALGQPGAAPSLFAFPAQSNFSGVKHPLELIREARSRGFRVFLDTAAYAPTNPLDLGAAGPDFACISFYKMFGYPTGLGALFARRAALAELERPWYAGGTVDFVSIQNDVYKLRPSGGGFEDGTPDFLGIAAVEPGLDLLGEIGMERLRGWVSDLTGDVLRMLTELRHEGGEPAVEIYGPVDTAMRGGTISFNLLNREGNPVPFEDVETAAGREEVSVRGGCFCNPGAAEVAFRMPPRDTLDCLHQVGEDFTLARFRECLGHRVPVGAVRVSLGMASSPDDVARLQAVLQQLLKA